MGSLDVFAPRDTCYSWFGENVFHFYLKTAEAAFLVMIMIYMNYYMKYCKEWYLQWRRHNVPGRSALKQGGSRRIALEGEFPPVISHTMNIAPNTMSGENTQMCVKENDKQIKLYSSRITMYIDYRVGVLRIFCDYDLTKAMVLMEEQLGLIRGGFHCCDMMAIVFMDIDCCPFASVLFRYTEDLALLPCVGCHLMCSLKPAISSEPQEKCIEEPVSKRLSKPSQQDSHKTPAIRKTSISAVSDEPLPVIDNFTERLSKPPQQDSHKTPAIRKTTISAVSDEPLPVVDNFTSDNDSPSAAQGPPGSYKDYVLPVLCCGGAVILLYGAYRYFRR